jgi:GTPase
LPHGLIDAFEATLQEACEADLLLHVIDAANPNFVEQISEVQRVLIEIGADKVPQVLVFNKLDALEKERWPLHMRDMYELDGISHARVFVSARDGLGLPALRALLAERASVVKAEAPMSEQGEFATEATLAAPLDDAEYAPNLDAP